ncbi:hypothetical protein ACQKWADRAFT_329251 [Trichoderma austrokoningii]
MNGHGRAAASDNNHPHSPHRGRQGCPVARDIIPRPAAPGPIDLELQAIRPSGGYDVDLLNEEPFFSSDEYADLSGYSTQSSPGTSFEHPDWEYADWARIIPARYVAYEASQEPDRKGCWQWGWIVLFVFALVIVGGVIAAMHH